MPVEYAQELMKNRANKITNENKKDIHEKNEKHLQDAYNEACKLVEKYNWYEVKCVRSGKIRTIDDIHEEIFQEIEKHIN